MTPSAPALDTADASGDRAIQPVAQVLLDRIQVRRRVRIGLGLFLAGGQERRQSTGKTL